MTFKEKEIRNIQRIVVLSYKECSTQKEQCAALLANFTWPNGSSAKIRCFRDTRNSRGASETRLRGLTLDTCLL